MREASSIEVLCGSAEFWTRVKNVVREFNLCCFERDEQTGKIRLISSENLESSTVSSKSDLWLAEKCPLETVDDVPAKQGWILVSLPRIDPTKKVLTSGNLRAKFTWLGPDKDKLFHNDELRHLMDRIRKKFYKDTIYSEVTLVWEPAHPNRTEKLRFTEGAVSLQSEGWSIKTSGGGRVCLPNAKASASR